MQDGRNIVEIVKKNGVKKDLYMMLLESTELKILK